MAKQLVLKGKTDVTLYVFIPDSSSAVGAGLTGLVYNAAGLVASYVRPLGSRVAITLATQTVTGAHSDGGFVEVDASNLPGLYRFDLPDAVVASGVDSAVVMLKGATNMVPVALELQLTSLNLQDSVRAGLTALPNAAADAAGGLPISDAGGLDLDTLNTRVAAIPRPIWEGTLDAVANGTVEFPSGYGISTEAQIIVEITQAGTHFGKSRFATYSGAGDVWDVDKAWNADGETTPTGTPTARAFSVPAQPATDLPHVDVRAVGGTSQTAGDLAALLATIDNLVDDLETRLTAARAGYLDNLSAGAVAQASALSTLAGYVDSEVAAILAIANKLDTALELDGAVYRFTLNALELAPTGGSAPTAEAIRQEIDANSTQLAAIVSAVADVPTNAELATALAAADDAVLAAIAALNNLSQANIRTAIGLSTANLDTQLAAIEDLVDELESRLTATRAGYLDNLSAGAVPTAVQNADALLGRSIAGGANGGRSVTSALRRLRNRVAIAAGTMTVYQEDDTTSDHTAAVTTAAGNPITEVNPV